MRDFARLDFNNHKTAKQPIVKNEVNEEFIVFEHNPLLPGNKGKSLPQFEQKISNMRNNRAFQIAFLKGGFLFKPKKL